MAGRRYADHPGFGSASAVWGAVRRPAIYELKGETTLAGLLDDAGGMTVAASLGTLRLSVSMPTSTARRSRLTSHRRAMLTKHVQRLQPLTSRMAIASISLRSRPIASV